MAQCGPGFDEWIEGLERKFCVISNLFNKFKKLFGEVFRGDQSQLVFRNTMEFSWLLFLLANGEVLGKAVDMVHSFHLLLCCVTFVISRTPQESLTSENLAKVSGKSENEMDFDFKIENLQYLCEYVGASFPEAKSMFDEHLVPFVTGLFSGLNEDKDLPDISDIVTNWHAVMETCLVKLNCLYEAKYLTSSNEIDHRMFLSPTAKEDVGSPFKAMSERTYSKSDENVDGMKSEFSKLPVNDSGSDKSRTHGFMETSNDLLRTPLTGKRYVLEMNSNPGASNSSAGGVPSTPVTFAVESVTRLKEILSNTAERPSPKLLDYFEECKTNPMKSIEDRLVNLCDFFKKEYVKSTTPHTSDIAVQLFTLGKKLYFRVLESVLSAERDRLQRKDFSQLLLQDKFHRSLLACSLEIVMYSYKLSGTNFPWILGVLDLCSYEFFKIVEMFIRHEPTLTRTLVKHFASLEEKILESMAWDPSSPLFRLCNDNRVPGWVNVKPASEDFFLPNTYDSTSQIYGSPTRRTPMATPHVTPGPPEASKSQSAKMDSPRKSSDDPELRVTGPSPMNGSSRKKSSSIDLFFRKVYNLANVRLGDLCEKLSLDGELRQKIWTVFEWTVMHEFTILMDRHLDQIIICALYAMSKVVGKEMQFRDIIAKYRTQPQASSHVYRSVLMTNQAEASILVEEERQAVDLSKRDSIIAFYNAVYLPRLRSYILQFSPESKGVSRSACVCFFCFSQVFEALLFNYFTYTI